MTEITHHPLCDEAWRHDSWEEQPCGICIAISKAYAQGRLDAADEVSRVSTKGGNGVWVLKTKAISAAKDGKFYDKKSSFSL